MTPRGEMKVKVGLITLLFTDVVGSTELNASLGDDANDRIRRTHFRVLRRVLRKYSGNEVKSLGDGLMVVFPSAVEAVGCAVAMQQAVARDGRARDIPLGIRIGLHSGEASQEENDYFGMPVVIAKRLCD